MKTPKEYYYTYYSYEEWGRGYIGSRGCKCLPEEDVNYFGSFTDEIFKPTQKIILKDDYATREEAYTDEIILQRYYKVVENPHFANRAYQTSSKFYVSKEQAIKNGKNSGIKAKELGIGFFSLTPEQKSEAGKKGGTKTYELGVGVFAISPEERTRISKKYGKSAGKIGGKKSYELGVGIHAQTLEEKREIVKKSHKTQQELNIGLWGMTDEQKSEARKKGGNRVKELKVGVCGLTKEERAKNGKENYEKTGLSKLSKEQRSENAKKTNSQKWMCTETGYITNSGALTHYQNKRGIDTSKRVKIL
jgi:hypothetical protein